jgi:hypothetical protein
MKRLLFIILALSISIQCYAPVKYEKNENKTLFSAFIEQVEYILKYEREKQNFKGFLSDLSWNESRNDYEIVNSIGAMGKYQFMPGTLKWLGYEVSVTRFEKDPMHFSPQMQEEAIIKLIESNRKILKEVIEKYDKTVVNGIFMTEGGILGAAHLAGAFGVKWYFQNGQNPADINGTSLEDYLRKFSHHDLSFDYFSLQSRDSESREASGDFWTFDSSFGLTKSLLCYHFEKNLYNKNENNLGEVADKMMNHTLPDEILNIIDTRIAKDSERSLRHEEPIGLRTIVRAIHKQGFRAWFGEFTLFLFYERRRRLL